MIANLVEFALADPGERRREENQQHILRTAKVTERDELTVLVFHREVRGKRSDPNRHECLPAAFDFHANHFLELEMATVAAQTLAITLIGNRLACNHPLKLPLALLGAAMLVKSGAIMLLMESVHGFAWITPGTLGGLALGLALALLALGCQADERLTIAAMALMLATVLANLMPDNPYLEDTLRVWQQGHFLNFNGLTRLVAAVWPFLALPWLMISRTKQ